MIAYLRVGFQKAEKDDNQTGKFGQNAHLRGKEGTDPGRWGTEKDKDDGKSTDKEDGIQQDQASFSTQKSAFVGMLPHFVDGYPWNKGDISRNQGEDTGRYERD